MITTYTEWIKLSRDVFRLYIDLQIVKQRLSLIIGLLHVKVTRRVDMNNKAREFMLLDAIEPVSNAIIDEVLAMSHEIGHINSLIIRARRIS